MYVGIYKKVIKYKHFVYRKKNLMDEVRVNILLNLPLCMMHIFLKTYFLSTVTDASNVIYS